MNNFGKNSVGENMRKRKPKISPIDRILQKLEAFDQKEKLWARHGMPADAPVRVRLTKRYAALSRQLRALEAKKWWWQRNPGMFGPDAVAKAKQVTKIRRVRHRDTGQLGEITGSAPSGWVKVKWDNRDKPTLIKRSEIALARGRKNPEENENKTVWRKGYEHGYKGLHSRPDYPKVGLAGSYRRGYEAGEKRRKQPKPNPVEFVIEFKDNRGNWGVAKRVYKTIEAATKAARLLEKRHPNWIAEKSLSRQKLNPSVTAIAEKFQGGVDGAIEEFHAASSAPANLARAGKLVFLKVGAKTFRLSGAMVAIAPNEKLWIVSKRAPVFSTKAKPGEGLDVGEISQICYETAKQHIGEGKRFEYVHEFGEDGGKRPHLIIDHEGMPILHGGDYKIRAEGIVN